MEHCKRQIVVCIIRDSRPRRRQCGEGSYSSLFASRKVILPASTKLVAIVGDRTDKNRRHPLIGSGRTLDVHDLRLGTVVDKESQDRRS